MAKQVDNAALSFVHWRGAFEQHLRAERRASQYTIRNYLATLAHFENFLAGHTGEEATLATLAGLEIRDFRAFLSVRRSDGLTPPSLKLELSALKTFINFCGSGQALKMTQSASCADRRRKNDYRGLFLLVTLTP